MLNYISSLPIFIGSNLLFDSLPGVPEGDPMIPLSFWGTCMGFGLGAGLALIIIICAAPFASKDFDWRFFAVVLALAAALTFSSGVGNIAYQTGLNEGLQRAKVVTR